MDPPLFLVLHQCPYRYTFFSLIWSDFLYKSALSSLLTLFNLTPLPLHLSFLTCSSLFLPSPFSNLSLCFSPFSWRLWLHVQNLRPIWRLEIYQIKRAWVGVGGGLFSIMGDCTALRAPSLLWASDSWHHQVETTAKWLLAEGCSFSSLQGQEVFKSELGFGEPDMHVRSVVALSVRNIKMSTMREMCQAYNFFPSACCLPAWMLYMMKIRTNQLEDIIMQSSSHVLCHNWKLELMVIPEPVMCRSEHRCLEHALCFHAVPLVCHLHLKLVPLIKSHMSPHNNNFKNPPSSSVPLNQSQTWQTARMELGCLQAMGNGERKTGVQSCRVSCRFSHFKVSH